MIMYKSVTQYTEQVILQNCYPKFGWPIFLFDMEYTQAYLLMDIIDYRKFKNMLQNYEDDIARILVKNYIQQYRKIY